MPEQIFQAVTGIIQNISYSYGDCCSQTILILTNNGSVNLVVGPDTFVADQTRLRTGMRITGFYDANLPVPLIYPPQYQAVAVTRSNPQEQVMLSYFDNTLTASGQALRLNIAPSTQVATSNGQRYSCTPADKLLMVYYRQTTRSIPPQTTPTRVIVFC